MTDHPVIFLDIDGVLNSAEYANAGGMGRRLGETHLDPKACALLERITQETSCLYVLSSAWRQSFSIRAMQNFIRRRGAPSTTIIGATPVDWDGHEDHTRRGREIASWMRANYLPKRWAILDDSDDMGEFLPYLVRTTWARGLEELHVLRLIDRLTED